MRQVVFKDMQPGAGHFFVTIIAGMYIVMHIIRISEGVLKIGDEYLISSSFAGVRQVLDKSIEL